MTAIQQKIEENYIENASVWEEVWEGDLAVNEAMDYLRVDEDDPLSDRLRFCLTHGVNPLTHSVE